MSDKFVMKEFTKRDVFYNNGLVNLKSYLETYSIEGLCCELNNEKLILKYPEGMDDKYYNDIFKGFIINNNIVFHTDNDRLYWDRNNNCFIYDRKYDVKGKSSGNDVKNLYKYITPTEIGKNIEEIFNEYIEFAKQHSLNNKNIADDTKTFKKGSSYKKENQCKIPILMTKSEAVERYIEYSVKGNMLKFDSKIHQFEDGGDCFRDMIDNKNNFIDKWDALIYWYGVKMKRYYNSSYFIYLNSTDLLALYEMKQHLDIKDDAITIKDEKKGKVKSIPTNVNLTKQLKFDGIENENFYISNSAKEFEVKFFMYLVSHIYHIEKIYENTAKERVRKRKERLYNSFPKISFVTYTEDGNMKSQLEEYTKAYKMMMLLNKLLETKYSDSTLFRYLSNLITSITMSKSERENINLNIKKFCDNILKFTDLRKVYYEVSFKVLKNNKRTLGAGLYEFENLYLNEIKRGDYVMSLHSKSKEIGREIGLFAANLEEKDLLFKLRNVKNHKQMVTYFKDLKFTVLKKQSEAKFTKKFSDIMEEILINMEDKPDSWEIIRDYIAIYAIDKYKAAVYAKQAVKGGK
ncbi:TPA: hypothetical protein ACXDAZ_000520 [Clostridium botulinum]|uniref:hypothetical protein n=1 Tax=Clostridium botulinum TaxID=1491 RepID=UPI00211D4BD1|nr:hypothetical protein [Clostridium botulinum]UUN82681.1 hypothetical protein K8O62_002222 [Clostridium botulinum]